MQIQPQRCELRHHIALPKADLRTSHRFHLGPEEFESAFDGFTNGKIVECLAIFNGWTIFSVFLGLFSHSILHSASPSALA